jgi:hypothetical protein
MKITAGRTAILTALALTITCAGIAPATVAKPAAAPATVATSADGAARSGEPRTVHVAGRQIPVDLANGLYEMRGSLVGDWRYIPKEVLHNTPTLYAEAGVEVFSGCIDLRPRDAKCTRSDDRGELHLAFLYWASFDNGGNLIKGQCVHPITGGKGVFAGARGVLRMVDTPVDDQVKTSYRGNIRLNAVPREGDAKTPFPSRTAGASSAQNSQVTSGRRAC